MKYNKKILCKIIIYGRLFYKLFFFLLIDTKLLDNNNNLELNLNKYLNGCRYCIIEIKENFLEIRCLPVCDILFMCIISDYN